MQVICGAIYTVQNWRSSCPNASRHTGAGISIAGREMTDMLSSGALLLVIGVVRSGLGLLGASNGRSAIVKSGEASSRAL